MRFLCPKCKAKYQIADEKLEGRAVRMKCRKCGHVIEVPSPTKSGLASAATKPGAAKPTGAKPTPVSPTSAKPAGARPAGAKAAAMRPTSAKPAPPRPAGSRPAGSKLGATAPPRPGAPRAGTPAPPSASDGASSDPQAVAPGGLASAFSQQVREPQPSDVSAAIEVLSAGAAEEWYVGVNGVPLGPVRLSTLRQKAQQGVIDEESLVWREGFEEWLPLRTFPELVVLVRESREAGSRISFTPSPPQAHTLSEPSPAKLAAVGRVPMPSPTAAAALAAPVTSPAPATEMEQEPATVVASSAEALAAIGQVTSDPFAPAGAPSKEPAADGLAPGQQRAGMPLADAGAAAVGTITIQQAEDLDDGARRSLVDDIAVGVRKQVRMHPAAYVLIAIAFGFGVTGAVVFFTNDRPPAPVPTIQVVTVAAPMNAAPGGTVAAAASVAMNTEGDKGKSGAHAVGRGVPGKAETKPGSESDPSPGTEKTSTPHRVGLGDGPSIDGPSVGGPSGGAESRLPQQLDQSDIERVVATHRVSVKRGCWEPALASRDPKAPKSAKVTVSIAIGPSGHVSSASASGGSGYPGLSSCVSNKVRGWKFPPSGGTSHANIPFAFFSQ